MVLHLNEFIFRFFYGFISFIFTWWVFFIYISVWLEFLIVNFNSCMSGVFFCLSSFVSSSIRVSLLLTTFLVIPFLLFELGCYLIPRLYYEEQLVCFYLYITVNISVFFCIFFWWQYLLPLLYFVFLRWFSASGIAITYIPELIALVNFLLFVFTGFFLVLQLPIFLFIGILVGFWDSHFLGSNRIIFYVVFILVSRVFSPPDFWFQFTLFFVFICSFE